MRENFSVDFHVNQIRGKLHEATIMLTNNVALFSLIVSDPARVIIGVNIYRTRKPSGTASTLSRKLNDLLNFLDAIEYTQTPV